jgi:ppGpp synthetase/RelA/SpoT-type nucleotidyltranferase
MARNIKPIFSKTRVNRAGENIRDEKITSEDLYVIENWRAAHNKILNDWQATIRHRCKGKEIIFAQRLKRKSTIFNKLLREPNMVLSRMHDIAGCRLIFNKIDEIYKFRENLHASSKKNMKHILRKADVDPYPYDYLLNPHPDNSGYRGIHDVFQYIARPGRSMEWNNLLVEIQYRTKAQHAWATANEIAGSLTGNYSKFDQGDESQKEFFRLTSEIISRAHENMKSCYSHLADTDLIYKYEAIERTTNLLRKLQTIKVVSKKIDFTKKNTILIYDEKESLLTADSFDSLVEAQNKYFELEKKLDSSRYDIVLVRAPSEDSLRQAYRNYFADARDFTSLVTIGVRSLKLKSGIL